MKKALLLIALFALGQNAYSADTIQKITCTQKSQYASIEQMTITLSEPITPLAGYKIYGLTAKVEVTVTDLYMKNKETSQKNYVYEKLNAEKLPKGYGHALQVLAGNSSKIYLWPKKNGKSYEGVMNFEDGILDLWLERRFDEYPLACSAQ